jgi:hypothetical protein
MIKNIVSGDCGNSPKNLFLQKLTIAFASGDNQFILASVAADICWEITGQRVIQGIDDFVRKLERLREEQTLELTIQHVVTHGKAGAVNGIRQLGNGKKIAFCDVYEFTGARGDCVREITSYWIDI